MVGLRWHWRVTLVARKPMNSTENLVALNFRKGPFYYRLGAGIWFEVDPGQLKLPPEPSHLPFGELAGADLDQFNRLGQRALSAQMLDDLAIAERLQGSLVFCQAALQ